MTPAEIAPERPPDRRARSAQSSMPRKRWSTRLGDAVTFYKIGYQLAYAGGLPLVAQARRRRQEGLSRSEAARHRQHGRARASRASRRLGATFLTVHAYPQTMKAAVEGARGSDLKILAVTVLTSYDDNDLHAAGYRLSVSELVEARAQQAQVLGVDGLVCSPEEVGSLAQDRRPPDASRHARHPAGGRGDRRPEAHHDAGAARSRPARIIWWSAGRSSKPPIRRRPRRRSSAEIAQALADEHRRRTNNGKRLLDRTRRCEQ